MKKFDSPYVELVVSKEDKTFTVEIMNTNDKDEIEQQTELKYKVLSNSFKDYSEKTSRGIKKLPDLLYDCNNENEIIAVIKKAVSYSFTDDFRPRIFNDVLKIKKSIITNPDYLKIVNLCIESLEKHLCIHTKIKSVIVLMEKEKENA